MKLALGIGAWEGCSDLLLPFTRIWSRHPQNKSRIFDIEPGSASRKARS